MSETVTTAEKAYTAGLNQSAQDQDALAARYADLELTPLGERLLGPSGLLACAQQCLEDKTASADEKRLAERLIDLIGPLEDPYLVIELFA